MSSVPCGKGCEKCPLFGRTCEGCKKEMSFSYSYRCRTFERGGPENNKECTGQPCKTVDGRYCLCPLVVEKSLRSIFRAGKGPDTPVQ
jgi:hypothetical protein